MSGRLSLSGASPAGSAGGGGSDGGGDDGAAAPYPPATSGRWGRSFVSGRSVPAPNVISPFASQPDGLFASAGEQSLLARSGVQAAASASDDDEDPVARTPLPSAAAKRSLGFD